MRIRVTYSVEVTERGRAAIARYYGGDGLASREEIQSELQQVGEVGLDAIIGDGETWLREDEANA